MAHVNWPEIEGFHNIRKTLVKWPELLGGRNVVRYRGKVKIHGTNAAVQVKHGKNCIAQSRTNIIGTGNDNCGFAAWVESTKEKWLATQVPNALVFGEWCGPGIMKGTAVNKIPNKIFAVFAVQPFDDLTQLIVEPSEIAPYVAGVPDTYVIPWLDHEDLEVRWLDQAEVLEPIAEEINIRVAAIDMCDPWVKAQFGQDGVGEGIVYYPISHSGRKAFGDLAFKAKGNHHKMVAKQKPVQVDPAIAQSLQDFAMLVCTPARLEQGITESAASDFDVKNMGKFLQWIMADVEKECRAEIEASHLEQRAAKKACMNYARIWFMKKSHVL
jgi:hypothetical protein